MPNQRAFIARCWELLRALTKPKMPVTARRHFELGYSALESSRSRGGRSPTSSTTQQHLARPEAVRTFARCFESIDEYVPPPAELSPFLAVEQAQLLTLPCWPLRDGSSPRPDRPVPRGCCLRGVRASDDVVSGGNRDGPRLIKNPAGRRLRLRRPASCWNWLRFAREQ